MRYTLAGCSRMRVGEGSSQKKEIENMIKIVLKTSKNRSRKRDVKNINKSLKKTSQKGGKNEEKNNEKSMLEKSGPYYLGPGTGILPLGPGGPTNQQDNLQIN